MRRAVLLFGAVVACWSDKGTPSTIGNRDHALVQRDLTGAYWCSIESSGFKYDRMPCAIRKIDDHFVLAKLSGSQRFTGEVKPEGQGFTFAGTFYCPYGDCSQPMHGRFRAVGGGALVGEFDDAQVIVRMVQAPDDAFGGVAYGGDGYGGFGEWGGTGYGGAQYGGHPNRTGRRNPRH